MYIRVIRVEILFFILKGPITPYNKYLLNIMTNVERQKSSASVQRNVNKYV